MLIERGESIKGKTPLELFFRFDGLSLLIAIVILPAAFVLPIWMMMSVVLGLDELIQLAGWIDILSRFVLATVVVLLSSFAIRVRHGATVKVGFVAKAIAVCVVILSLLQLFGIIDLF